MAILLALVNFFIISLLGFIAYTVSFGELHKLPFHHVLIVAGFLLVCGFSPSTTKQPFEMAIDRFVFTGLVFLITLGALAYDFFLY